MTEAAAAIVESAAPPEMQARAEKLGWIPPTRFKGDPERFVDAEDYIRRGEEVLPIVKEQNRRLREELETVKGKAAEHEAALAKAQKAIELIEERHSVATQKAVEKARAEVKKQLASASEAGDHEGVAELTDQLTQLNAAETKAEAKAEAKEEQKPAPWRPPEEMVEWNRENAWFGKDDAKTSLALGIATRLRKEGDKSEGREFFDKVSKEVARRYREDDAEPPVDKVEGARQSGEGGGSRGKGYNSLPADAKAACDADIKRFVGEGKKYKTAAEWRSQFAALYFEGN
jgi:hypothetical protein